MIRFFLFIFLTSFSFATEWGSETKAETNLSSEKTFRILSLDGGGIRGAYTAQIIALLEEELHFLQYVDFFVGSSTGSILACGLAYGVSPQKLVEFYQKKSKEIFKRSGGISDVLKIHAKYSVDSFKKVITDVIPLNVKLSDLPKKVLCLSFSLFNPFYNNWTPDLIDNFDNSTIPVADAILRSTAAPIYFPSYQNHVDGGLVANNPSMMALARALDKNGANQNLSSIRLLSIGTGITMSYIVDDVNWGTLEWMYNPSLKSTTPSYPLLDLIFDGTVSAAHFQCSRILGSSYFRINPFLKNEVLLDDSSKVDLLIQEAKDLPENSPEEWEKIILWIKEEFLPK